MGGLLSRDPEGTSTRRDGCGVVWAQLVSLLVIATGSRVDPEAMAAIYRAEVGRCTATLVRVLGDVDRAEDAVAEAFAVAARRWPTDGVPANPGGWITTTARNWAIDQARREAKRPQRHIEAAWLAEDDPAPENDLGNVDVVADDQLRLIFLCCHPSLPAEAQVALTLRLLGGLTTPEIARAFLIAESALAQRLVRAKRRIRDDQIAYRIPDAADLPARLTPVLATVYLVFNEGHTASSGEDLTRPDLSTEAVRLARLIVELLPDEPEGWGLLALMLLTEARRPARVAADGSLVRLADQDRTRWDRSSIAEGQRLVRRCLERNEPGPYQIQAAIAAVHADASRADATDWVQIVALYDQLHAMRPDDVVGLNRAIAVAELEGPARGLEELERLDLDTYHLFHATRGELQARLGLTADARAAYDRAIELSTNDVERRHLSDRRREL